jgi:hypothetical protein
MLFVFHQSALSNGRRNRCVKFLCWVFARSRVVFPFADGPHCSDGLASVPTGQCLSENTGRPDDGGLIRHVSALAQGSDLRPPAQAGWRQQPRIRDGRRALEFFVDVWRIRIALDCRARSGFASKGFRRSRSHVRPAKHKYRLICPAAQISRISIIRIKFYLRNEIGFMNAGEIMGIIK